MDESAAGGQFIRAAEQIIEEGVEQALAGLMRSAPTLLAEMRDYRKGFEERLRERWGEAFDLYDLTLQLATESGERFNATHRPDAVASNDLAFEALARIHARACLAASEVRSLLAGGYATGANARWRTLHELAVSAFFIRERGGDVAERYLLHQAIDTAKAADEYQRAAPVLGNDPLTDEEIGQIRATKSALLDRYGEAFSGHYGWAAAALAKQRPNFADLERAAGLGHIRGWYQMASYGVHPAAKGSYFDLGLMGDSRTLLAGPSNAGLADPGHHALISLVQCSLAFVQSRWDLRAMIEALLLIRLVDEAGAAFLAAHNKLRQDEEALRAEEG